MKRSLWLALTLVLVAAPARAQTSAILLFANGGRWWPVSDMSSETGDKFSAEWSYGGGLGWQFHDRAALRLSVNHLQTNWIGDRLFEVFPTVTDRRFNRTYFMADIQYGWPTAKGLIPYIYAGGGAVYTSPKDDELESFTDFTGRFGGGLNIISAIGVWFLETDMAAWRLNSLDVEFHGLKIELSLRVGWVLVIPY
jgi:hypothetical protein